MGKRKETPLPKINGEAEPRKSLRLHGQRANYQEVSSDYDSDDSRGMPFRLTRALETEMVSSDRNLIAENASMDLIARGTRGPGEGESAATCTSNAAETTESGRGRGRGGRGNSQSGCGTRGLVEGENAATCARSGWGRGRGGRGNSQSGCDTEKKKEIPGWLAWGKRTGIPQRREGSPPPPPPPPPPTAPEQMRFSGKKTILSWLINHELVKEGEEVCYYVDGKPRRAGRVTKGGIICSCCQREISVWDFEKHARSGLRQPYKCICLQRERQNNTCLQHFQIAAWQKPMESKRRTMFSYVPKENAAHGKDDTCSICGDGGDLICCEKCPSTNHPSCINMESVPHTNWFCPYCICKFCGLGGEYKEFITCCQCDKKFHWRCFKESEKDFSRETLDASCLRLYCGPDCMKIYEKLEGSLGVIPDKSASYSWRVVCPMDMISTALASEDSYIENNSKVAVAGMLMSEAFDSITDRCTSIDMVQSVVYSRGSNLNRIHFSRFYTFILEKNDEMIAAASVRIHGKEIAEMPFIATVEAYRGQGNCQMLMKAIESFLCDLNVENLIIPSTAETVEMWKRKYSFNVVNDEVKRKISMYNTLMFPWAVRLCKDLKGITDSGRGDENESCQTDFLNDPVSQLAQVECPTNDNDTGNTQPVVTEKPLETDIRNGRVLPETAQGEGPTFDNDIGNAQSVVVEISLETDIRNGLEEPEESGQEERPTQTYTQNSVELEPMQAAQTDRHVKFRVDLNEFPSVDLNE